MYNTSSSRPMGGSPGYNLNPYSVRRPTGTQQKTTNTYYSAPPAQPQRPTTSAGASYALNGRATSTTTTSPSIPQRFPEGYTLNRGSLAGREVTQQPTGGNADTPIPLSSRYGSGAHVAASPQAPARSSTQPLPRDQRQVDPSSFTSLKAQGTSSYSPSNTNRATTRAAQPQYPDTPLPGVRSQSAASPVTPSSVNGGRVLYTPTGPYILPRGEVRETFSPATPFVGRTVPPSYQAHRAKMGEISKKHKDLLALMEQFGCSRVSRFTEYFNERFASFMFPKEDRDLMLKMDEQFATFHEIFGNSGDIFFKLMRDYQTYEKLVKMTHGPERKDYSEQLGELEKSLSKNEKLVEARIATLSLHLNNFLFGLFSYMSGKSINDARGAFEVFRGMNHHYTNVVKTFQPPKNFAGMDFAYRDLIRSARNARGLDWLSSLVRAALVENAARNLQTYNNEPMKVDVKWLSGWVKNKMSSQGRNSPEIEEALLKLNASVGCWDQLVTNGKSIAGTGSSIELFLRFSGMDTNTINYPLPGLKITPALQAQFNKLNSEQELASWVNDVEFFFSAKEKEGKLKSRYPENSWRYGSPTNLKEKAVLIYSLKLTVPNAALVEKAEALAQKIVSHIYTHELTRDLQQ